MKNTLLIAHIPKAHIHHYITFPSPTYPKMYITIQTPFQGSGCHSSALNTAAVIYSAGPESPAPLTDRSSYGGHR